MPRTSQIEVASHLDAPIHLNRRRFLGISAGALALLTGAAGRNAFAAQATPTATGAISGVFFDGGVVHAIAATFDQDAYDAMIETFSSSGDKEWIEATVSIDGETYEQVGLRLKGNSSLMGLRETNDSPSQGDERNDRREGPGGDVSADKPESLPWLVRLDKYVDDQNHHGLSEFVIRANNSKTSLNEAVALDLLTEAGLASQAAAPVAFSVNSGDPVLRLAIELPDDAWMAAHFSADGILYKSEAEGDWSYLGTDPESYKEAFDLEAGGNGDDADAMQPLIAFLDFVNNSDDATFIQELPDRLDIDAFADYLAMMELIRNFDDIDGPGNNSYLYYDPASASFTIVPWDMNLAFAGMMNGANGGPVVRIDGQVPGGGAPPAMPGASGTPTVEFRGPGDGQGMNGAKANPLVERFNANDDFAALVSAASTQLRDDLYNSGLAATILAGRVAVLENGAIPMVDQATITSEADTVAAFFEPAS